jgi:hypothetical protein
MIIRLEIIIYNAFKMNYSGDLLNWNQLMLLWLLWEINRLIKWRKIGFDEWVDVLFIFYLLKDIYIQFSPFSTNFQSINMTQKWEISDAVKTTGLRISCFAIELRKMLSDLCIEFSISLLKTYFHLILMYEKQKWSIVR